MLIYCVSGSKYIFGKLYIIVHSWERQYSYTKFKTDSSKQFSTYYPDNQFKFISMIMAFKVMRRLFARLVKFFSTVYSLIY